MAERLAFIAPVGQNSWQQKQRTHFFLSISALPRTMRIAEAGQPRAQFPQPVQSAPAAGREANIAYIPRLASLRRAPSSSDDMNHEAVAPERLKSLRAYGAAAATRSGSSGASSPRRFAASR